MTVVEAVLEVVATWERRAQVLADCHVGDRARVISDFAREVREVVEANQDDWLTLEAVSAHTGYCADTLRERAKELKKQGLARKVGGRWMIERTTALAMSRKARPVSISEWRSDASQVARRLARER